MQLVEEGKLDLSAPVSSYLDGLPAPWRVVTVRQLMRADHRRLPFTIGTDKHASYPEAFAPSVKEKILPSDGELRRVKYLNNIIEQDHRAIRGRWRAMQRFRSFQAAERTIERSSRHT
jgi:transposase-like protein